MKKKKKRQTDWQINGITFYEKSGKKKGYCYKYIDNCSVSVVNIFQSVFAVQITAAVVP